MKKQILLLGFLCLFACGQSQGQDLKAGLQSQIDSIIPIKFTIKGQLRDLKEVGIFCPNIHFFIGKDYVELIVGINEYYKSKIEATGIKPVLDSLFTIDDFQKNGFFYNPYFKYMGILETQKLIDGALYHRKIYNYRRGDMEIDYQPMDSTELIKFTILSHFLNQTALRVLQDSIDGTQMIRAESMHEALKEPESVYELSLRNKRVKSLEGIGKLVNLRVLDISGSYIEEIPEEIENCQHLIQILANASRLSKIPSSIGTLQH